jgi:isoamylase
VLKLVADSLRFWATEMHVDGFRFDLASILDRDASGRPMLDPPVLSDIESDPALAGTKLIAEAWDAAGLYQVGTFAGDSWLEWNGPFRDDLRSFFRGDGGSVARVADRIVGSPQIYGCKQREPEVSVNFVTCHDGFTLNDLVSYAVKHNQGNGESNRDGTNDNRSWNCGVEGPTRDVAVEALRERQIRNLLACTIISLGMPMIAMGDEIRRTQGGNNNAYCQDNETSWFDWSLVSKHAGLLRFVRLLIDRRLRRDMAQESGTEMLIHRLRNSKKSWHGVKLNQPDWSDSSHSIALSAEIVKNRLFIHWILNAWQEPLDFELPTESGQWNRWIDTSLESPEDIVAWEEARSVFGQSYRAAPNSVVVLFSSIS